MILMSSRVVVDSSISCSIPMSGIIRIVIMEGIRGRILLLTSGPVEVRTGHHD